MTSLRRSAASTARRARAARPPEKLWAIPASSAQAMSLVSQTTAPLSILLAVNLTPVMPSPVPPAVSGAPSDPMPG